MALKKGHGFHAKHGFSGSAGKDMKPSIPGFKSVEQAEGGKEHFGSSSHVDHDGERSMGGKVSYDKHGFQHHKKGGMC